jgi:hypothetical protein
MARCNCITRNQLHTKACAVVVAGQGISYEDPVIQIVNRPRIVRTPRLHPKYIPPYEWKVGDAVRVTRKLDGSSFQATVSGPSRHGKAFIAVYHEKGFYLSVATSMLTKVES